MNGKISQILGFRNYQQHSHNLHHQQLNRFSSHTWKHLLDRLKEEFPNATKRLDYFKAFQNGLKLFISFLGKESSPIVAQRAFRGYRILQLHSKLWSYSCNNPVTKRSLLSFVILSLCQANTLKKGIIEDAELSKHSNDLEFIRELTAATVVCPKCKDRLVIDKKIQGVEYCHCPDAPATVYSRKIDGYSWVPFVETADLLIWRQPHPEHSGLYVYKVYGYYDDISADDFLNAQLDIEYRKQWDDTALQLEVIETDEKSKSEVIYWEMKWPKMFSNRDYVFVRRHKVDSESNDMVIMSRAVTHPLVPERKGVLRVKEYWSVMHIRAPRGLSQPGVEFGLTYFDNPGVSLPQWLTNWAAMSAIPDFLNKQRNAARAKRARVSPTISISVSPPTPTRAPLPDKEKQKQSSSPSSPPSSPKKPASSSNKRESVQPSQGRVDENLNQIISNDKATVNVPTANNVDTNIDENSRIVSSSPGTPASSVSQPLPQPSQQEEGKNELLSQFFKEQILDVHS